MVLVQTSGEPKWVCCVGRFGVFRSTPLFRLAPSFFFVVASRSASDSFEVCRLALNQQILSVKEPEPIGKFLSESTTTKRLACFPKVYFLFVSPLNRGGKSTLSHILRVLPNFGVGTDNVRWNFVWGWLFARNQKYPKHLCGGQSILEAQTNGSVPKGPL